MAMRLAPREGWVNKHQLWQDIYTEQTPDIQTIVWLSVLGSWITIEVMMPMRELCKRPSRKGSFNKGTVVCMMNVRQSTRSVE